MKERARFRYMTPQEASGLMALARKYYSGEIDLPPEIQVLKKVIERKTRTAELFAVVTGAVDNSMVYEIVDLKLQLDTLYGEWIKAASPKN